MQAYSQIQGVIASDQLDTQNSTNRSMGTSSKHGTAFNVQTCRHAMVRHGKTYSTNLSRIHQILPHEGTNTDVWTCRTGVTTKQQGDRTGNGHHEGGKRNTLNFPTMRLTPPKHAALSAMAYLQVLFSLLVLAIDAGQLLAGAA